MENDTSLALIDRAVQRGDIAEASRLVKLAIKQKTISKDGIFFARIFSLPPCLGTNFQPSQKETAHQKNLKTSQTALKLAPFIPAPLDTTSILPLSRARFARRARRDQAFMSADPLSPLPA
jgi:hypothetical protein